MYRPEKLDDIIGQNRVKTVVRTMIQAAKIKGTPLPHILLYSSSGSGKSTMARCIANEMEASTHFTTAARLKKAEHLYELFNPEDGKVKSGDCLFIDEIHSLDKKISEWFYIVMEDFKFHSHTGKEISVAPFTLIGATTNMGLLVKPFRDRFQFHAELEDYSLEELKEIVHSYSEHQNHGNIKFSDEVAEALAKTSRDTPRILIHRVEFLRDYMISQNLSSISVDEALQIIELQGVNRDGLTKLDERYLEVIKKHGPISLREISSRLDMDQDTIKNEVEPYLAKRGYISVTNKGRKATRKAGESNLFIM